MDPQNEPWTPKPYQPKSDEPQTPPAAPVQPVGDPYAWQRSMHPSTPDPKELPLVPGGIQSGISPQSPEPIMQPEAKPAPQLMNPPQAPWTPGVQQQHATGPSLNPTQQYGGQMAELPPLAAQHSTTPKAKKQRLALWLVVAALVLLPTIGIGIYLYSNLSKDSEQQKTAQQLEQVTYNNDALAALAKAPLTNEAISKLNKEDTFFTMLKAGATSPIVQTKWDVYYTDKQDGERTDQYTLYDTTIDYRSKKYAYAENTYSNLGIYQTRCIGDKQYNFNDSKLTTSPAWQPASDSTDCKLNTVTMHTSDGINPGGLNSNQADTFMRKIKGYNLIKVNKLSVATNKDKQYIKVDLEIVPQKQGDNIYWGMQLLMNAFQETGVDPDKHPYTYFGSGREGAKVSYYFDAATQLPVYSVSQSTAPLNGKGEAELAQSWSHRYIEYAYPQTVAEQTLSDSKPIGFTAWPDH